MFLVSFLRRCRYCWVWFVSSGLCLLYLYQDVLVSDTAGSQVAVPERGKTSVWLSQVFLGCLTVDQEAY